MTSSPSNEKPKKTRTAARTKPETATGATKAKPAARQAKAGSARKKDGARPAAAHTPTDEQIAIRAFEIWERQGRPDGQQMENWLEAERELAQEAGR